ncbi:MAG: O-antigen ligase family protein [Patescibacteria group bacterium]|jgi:putative inorganic carbon (HCO3(-)) transporter
MNIIITIIILLVLSLFLAKPQLGLYLSALLLPLLGWDIQVYAFTFPLIDLIALLACLAVLGNWLFFKLKKSTPTPLRWPLFIPFLIFFIVNLISSLWAPAPLTSLYYFIRWPFFLYFAYIFTPANLISDVKTLRKTIILVFIGSLTVLLFGYLSLLDQNISHSFFRLKSISLLGVYPFGENHNLIAEYLNVGVFFVLIIKEMIKDQTSRRLTDILFIIMALGIVLTFSRAAWITLAIQLLIYFLYQLRYNLIDKQNLLTFIILGLIISSPLMFKMSSLQSDNTGSTDSRLVLSEISVKAWQEKPWFGQGSGEFINLVDKDLRFRANFGEAMDSHGSVQKVLAENGTFGLLAWLGILIYLARLGYLALRKYYPTVPWMLPFALAAFGGIFFQFFNTSYYKGRVWFPLALFIIAIELSEKISSSYVKENKDTSNNS